MDKKRIRNDIILILALIFLAALVWLVISLSRTDGRYAVVTIDGVETGRYPLEKDIVVELKSEGGHVNMLVINDGKAYISSADCPDKLCVKHKAVDKNGETIVCLPHKLVVCIKGGEAADIDG